MRYGSRLRCGRPRGTAEMRWRRTWVSVSYNYPHRGQGRIQAGILFFSRFFASARRHRIQSARTVFGRLEPALRLRSGTEGQHAGRRGVSDVLFHGVGGRGSSLTRTSSQPVLAPSCDERSNPLFAQGIFFPSRHFLPAAVQSSKAWFAGGYARCRVRAGSAAQRQVARPVRVGQAQDLAQVRRISVCRAQHGPGAPYSAVTNGLLDRDGKHALPAARRRGFCGGARSRRGSERAEGDETPDQHHCIGAPPPTRLAAEHA